MKAGSRRFRAVTAATVGRSITLEATVAGGRLRSSMRRARGSVSWATLARTWPVATTTGRLGLVSGVSGIIDYPAGGGAGLII